jgi:hypothetical protein
MFEFFYPSVLYLSVGIVCVVAALATEYILADVLGEPPRKVIDSVVSYALVYTVFWIIAVLLIFFGAL